MEEKFITLINQYLFLSTHTHTHTSIICFIYMTITSQIILSNLQQQLWQQLSSGGKLDMQKTALPPHPQNG